jgi:hypothetical protein
VDETPLPAIPARPRSPGALIQSRSSARGGVVAGRVRPRRLAAASTQNYAGTASGVRIVARSPRRAGTDLGLEQAGPEGVKGEPGVRGAGGDASPRPAGRRSSPPR